MNSYTAWHALTGEHDCAPAQEEKEMGNPKRTICKKCGSTAFEEDGELWCPTCSSKQEDQKDYLRERWDRAFFAVLGAGKGVTMAQAHAEDAIRRHADMMAARDAIIAEVVG